MNTDKILQHIDEYFEQKKQSEINIIFFGSAFIICAFIYFSFYDSSNIYLKNTSYKFTQVDNSLANTNYYLKSISSQEKDEQFVIKKKKKKISESLLLLDKIKEKNLYLDEKLKNLSYLLFNQKSWANFLDQIILTSKQENIKIINLENTFTKENDKKVNEVLKIKLDIVGNFHNLLNFINKLEESSMVTDITSLIIEKENNTLKSSIYISIWGLIY